MDHYPLLLVQPHQDVQTLTTVTFRIQLMSSLDVIVDSGRLFDQLNVHHCVLCYNLSIKSMLLLRETKFDKAVLVKLMKRRWRHHLSCHHCRRRHHIASMIARRHHISIWCTIIHHHCLLIIYIPLVITVARHHLQRGHHIPRHLKLAVWLCVKVVVMRWYLRVNLLIINWERCLTNLRFSMGKRTTILVWTVLTLFKKLALDGLKIRICTCTSGFQSELFLWSTILKVLLLSIAIWASILLKWMLWCIMLILMKFPVTTSSSASHLSCFIITLGTINSTYFCHIAIIVILCWLRFLVLDLFLSEFNLIYWYWLTHTSQVLITMRKMASFCQQTISCLIKVTATRCFILEVHIITHILVHLYIIKQII